MSLLCDAPERLGRNVLVTLVAASAFAPLFLLAPKSAWWQRPEFAVGLLLLTGLASLRGEASPELADSWASNRAQRYSPAAVGLLLLIGIVVNNGIVMIEHINMYRRAGMSREEAMLRGGRERLRPILMTALTTLIGLAPIAVQKPSLAGVYYYSMALVIMGGLVVSTFLTSVLLPTTTSLVEDTFSLAGRGVRGTARRIGGFPLFTRSYKS